jgi:hypothetical protein
MRRLLISLLLVPAACTIGGVNALPPLGGDATGGDGGVSPGDDGGGAADATACTPGADGDGDGLDDCDELGDGDPFTDPEVWNGLTAIIGDRPEWTGSCDNLDDWAEMDSRFAASTRRMKVRAGWDFDTSADDYADPSYGFDPNWTESDSGRFSVRFTGLIRLAEAGPHCFSVDIGATGTDLIGGRNGCGQVWLNAGDGAGETSGWLAETGFSAESNEARIGCVELPAGVYSFDIVFWYFNVLEQAILHVRSCGSPDCTISMMLDVTDLQAP